IILGWPESLLTWDILFLLPVTWTGPVITPIVVSTLMIILSIIINYFNIKLKRQEWLMLIVGATIIFTSFIWDYCKFLVKNIDHTELQNKALSDKLIAVSLSYIPVQFPWLLFVLGILFLLFTFYIIYKRTINVIHS
ncbi:MAG: hypothetical protein C0597_04630, partial [Marinilabiliales bacterium]